METTKTKQTNLDFNYITAASLLSLREIEEFSVGFDNLWQWCGYSTKGNAKKKLVKNFEEGVDFSVIQLDNTRQDGGYSQSELKINLTVDASKEFAMLAQTEQGKQVRKYFIEAEKQYRNNLIRIREQQEFVVGQLEELKVAQTAMRQEIVNELRAGLAPINTWDAKFSNWIKDLKGSVSTLAKLQPTLNKIFSVVPAGYITYQEFKDSYNYTFKRGAWSLVEKNLDSSKVIEKSPLNRVRYYERQEIVDTINSLNITGSIKINYGSTGKASKATVSL